MSESEDPLDSGKTFLSNESPFPASTGGQELGLEGGSFEAGLGSLWRIGGLKVSGDGAKEGSAGLQTSGEAYLSLLRAECDVEALQPHVIGFWVRSNIKLQIGLAFDDARNRWGKNEWATVPSTEGEWKYLTFYFRAAEGASRATLSLKGKGERPEVSLDSFSLRTATEEQYAAAYRAWRKRFPERDLSPRPNDGKHLLLTLRKLSSESVPRDSFIIWALGSSYTNMLGMGDTLRQIIRERFPAAPPIIYRKHVGSSVTWNYLRGWYRHQTNADQPDLILIYAGGKPEDLDALLKEIRETSTADIIVASLHWRMIDAKLWRKSEDAIDQQVQAVRDVCQNYDVEFVENRKEWAQFMEQQGMDLDLREDGLLKDSYHQSDYGALIINENIARHFVPHSHSDGQPEGREIIREVKDSDWKDGVLEVNFTGNRIDLIGVGEGEAGGELEVFIDGHPATEAPAFFCSAIEPGAENSIPAPGLAGDFAPHGVELGAQIVPQQWTIRMLDDDGNYELSGSVTGRDGTGHVLGDFRSQSGQIFIPTALWRQPTVPSGPNKGAFSNRKGERFTFSVTQAGVKSISFRQPKGFAFRKTLIANLPNASHQLRLVQKGQHLPSLKALEIFRPPLPASSTLTNSNR